MLLKICGFRLQGRKPKDGERSKASEIKDAMASEQHSG
jgi:hypothetical protein